MRKLIQKWRPSLWFVTGGALFGTVVTALVGLVIFRYIGPEVGFRVAALAVGAGITLVTFVLWLLLLRLLLRPVAALSQFAAAVQKEGSADTPPDHFGTREIFKMGQEVVDMANTLRTRAMTIRTYTDHVTHELKTPLSTLSAVAELLEDSTDLSDGDKKLVAQIQMASRQMDRQLISLKEMAAAREARYIGETYLSDVLPQIADAAGSVYITIVSDGRLPISTKGMAVVLGHIVNNARMHGATRIDCTVRRSDDRLTLYIANNGSGISTGNHSRLFEPFFTTRREHGGTGMGLAIVSALLQAHGASIALSRWADGDVAFEIDFPPM
ncbi:MAG: HAMP domain-containing sensor histidine kinase [Pseudomonadota bacterium]